MAIVTIVTIGTRGDVVPYTALGAALTATGDRVTVATHASLRRFVDEAGLGFAALPVEFGDGPLSSARLTSTLVAHWPQIGRAIAAPARDADLLLLAPMGLLGYHVAEARGIPSMGAFLQPLEPTRAFPPLILTTNSLGGRGNRAAGRAFRLLGQLPFARATAAFRAELGLAPLGPRAMFRRMERERWPAVYGVSPTVVPPPDDWPAHRPMTGYWWPPAGTGLSERLRTFLDDGEPPIFIGFGSMTAPGSADAVRGALKHLGRRAVVQRGAAGLSAEGRNVLVIDEEPHAWLFPRTAVVVHHGGAGTTAAALRAGVPSVAVPFTADQPFWGERIAALDSGPRPVPMRGLTPRRLAQAIEEAPAFRPGAAAVARRLAVEDGPGAAVAEIRKVG
ncbi:glycosyltransferase [Actinoplanes sp. HUAS TT8]|uniref:glycosyltransferase n=1 Tax=Actinoplanes sp. HUAS TT8 TaxID=3447453 RepID=UPI003F5211A4